MSQVIVLDSHIWFWWVNPASGRLAPDILAAIEDAERVGVSAASCYELALAHHRGRLDLAMPPSEWFPRALAGSGVELLALTPEIAVRATALSPIHRDLFDRLIIATALHYDGRLASVDRQFSAYSELAGRLLGQSGDNERNPS